MTTSTVPHNVDICVTCVSDRPPELPLREELPSLGIEVVYNARGLGADESQRESQKLVEDFQKKRKASTSIISPVARLLQSPQRREQVQQERNRREKELRIPHALSYSSYQKRLAAESGESSHNNNNSGHSGREPPGSSFSSAGSRESGSDRENRQSAKQQPMGRYDQHPKSPENASSGRESSSGSEGKPPPITALEFPSKSQEDMAVEEAFGVFGDVQNTFGLSQGRETSTSTNDSTLSASVTKHNKAKPVTLVTSGTAKFLMPTLPSASSSTGGGKPSDGEDSSHDTGSSNAARSDAVGHKASLLRSKNKNKSGKMPPSLKLPRVNEKGHFDLTEVSDDEKYIARLGALPVTEDDSDFSDMSSKDLSTLSSSKRGTPTKRRAKVEVYPSEEMRDDLSDLRLLVPEKDDDFGRLVLDLSDVVEENGPGSPLIYSPNRSYDRNNSSAQQGKKTVIHGPRKQHDGDRVSYIRDSENDGASQDPPTSFVNDFFDGDDPAELFLNNFEKFEKEHLHPRMGKASAKKPSDTMMPWEKKKAALNEKPLIHSPSKSYDGREDAALISPVLKETSYSREQAFFPLKDSNGLRVTFSQEVERRTFENDDNESKPILSPTRPNHRRPDLEDTQDLLDRVEKKLTEQKEFGDLTAEFSSDGDDAFDAMIRGSELKELDPIDALKDLDPIDAEDHFSHSREVRPSDLQLTDALSYDSDIPPDFLATLAKFPGLVKNPLPGSSTYPLHAACLRQFPDRFGQSQVCKLTDLVRDVKNMKALIDAIVASDPISACRLDDAGDLPAHLMARQLMEWEARWYQKVYETARQESEKEAGSGAGITTLYQTMSQCIDVLLKPVANDTSACKATGSVGTLLPLHLAAIFTVSYDTLKALLETYPEGAGRECDLEAVRTFIPNSSIPLELHTRLSTDFPKWEIEKTEAQNTNEQDIQWTQSTLDKSYGTEGGMRRSDLMFAFFPEVIPFRHETQRIRRLESRIRTEVADLKADDQFGISEAAQRVWKWMCTYENSENDDDHYADSVKRILKPMQSRSVKGLAALQIDGKSIIDSSTSKCVEILYERLREVEGADIPVPIASLATGFFTRHPSTLLQKWEVDVASRYCLQGRGFVGVISRTLFNITESSFPTNFVFLPYRLVKDRDGRLGLASAKDAHAAMKYAESLLALTDPQTVLHILSKKALRYQGARLSGEDSETWFQMEEKTKRLINSFMNLYDGGAAYLYFLDEFTGSPIVPSDSDQSLYPLMMSDPVDMVRKCLPLMLSGMILMRGEKALSVLVNVLLSESVTLVQQNWIDAGVDLLGFLYSPQTEWTNSFLQDLLPLREKLVSFVEKGATKAAPDGGRGGLTSEWVVELSLIKMIVEMHDPCHEHCGLLPRRTGEKVLWTTDARVLNPECKDHLHEIDFRSLADLRDMTPSESITLAKVSKRTVSPPAIRTSFSLQQENPAAYDKLVTQQKSLLDEDNDQEEEIHLPEEDAERRLPPTTTTTTTTREVGSAADAYEPLFQELAMTDPKSTTTASTSPETVPSMDRTPSYLERQLPPSAAYASASKPISLIQFDDDLDLDDVLQLRILLDEQEAKLEFLRDKIEDLQDAEDDLLNQEEKLEDILDDINDRSKMELIQHPSKRGLTQARKLLLRICSLEDRVLCREVEVGQLKNDVSFFELEVSQQDDEAALYPDIPMFLDETRLS